MSTSFEEDKQAKLRPDGDHEFNDPGKFMEWALRHYYSEHIAELKGDADELIITEVHVYADELPEIVYAVKNP